VIHIIGKARYLVIFHPRFFNQHGRPSAEFAAGSFVGNFQATHLQASQEAGPTEAMLESTVGYIKVSSNHSSSGIPTTQMQPLASPELDTTSTKFPLSPKVSSQQFRTHVAVSQMSMKFHRMLSSSGVYEKLLESAWWGQPLHPN